MEMSNNSSDWQLSLKVQSNGISISILLSLFKSYNMLMALLRLRLLQLITHEATMKYNPKMVPLYLHTINMAAMKISGVG